MKYYKHHIGDYWRNAAHLNLVEEGAYRRLIDIYYSTELPIPLDQRTIYKLIRAKSKDERQAVDDVLKEFFNCKEDGWHQKRCTEEISLAHEKSTKAQVSATLRWHGKKNANAQIKPQRTHKHDDAKAMRSSCEGNANHYPLPTKEILQEVSTGVVDNSEPKPVEVEHVHVKTDAPKPQAHPSFTVQCLTLATSLHKLGVAVTAQHTVLQKWVSEGFTQDKLNEAVELARQRKPEPETISAAYLDSIVRRTEVAA